MLCFDYIPIGIYDRNIELLLLCQEIGPFLPIPIYDSSNAHLIEAKSPSHKREANSILDSIHGHSRPYQSTLLVILLTCDNC